MQKKNEGVAAERIPYFVDFMAFCSFAIINCLVDCCLFGWLLSCKKKFSPYGEVQLLDCLRNKQFAGEDTEFC
jgi:hypothetical protein